MGGIDKAWSDGLVDYWIDGFQYSINPIIQIIQMPKVQLNMPAPDFTLNDFKDEPVRLAEFRGGKNVVLVFNRGFL